MISEYTPIQALNPVSDSWVIKARITQKSEMRKFTSVRGEGQVFSIELIDANKGEIRGSFFNQDAKKFYDKLEIGKCYVIRYGQIKVANQRYQKCNNEYEIRFNYNTTFKEETDDIGVIIKKYPFLLNFLIAKIKSDIDKEHSSITAKRTY